MKKNIPLLKMSLLAMVVAFGCQPSEKKGNSTKVSDLTQNPDHHSDLKLIEPEIGATPDISNNAKINLQRQKALYAKIDSTVNSYPDYETAKQHLSQRQIEMYENEEAYGKDDHLDVSIWGCSWYCGGGPASQTATSALAPAKGLDYKAENAHDFSLRTAWIEGKAGRGIGESITYRFAKQSPPVTTVEIYNGYMKSDKIWKENARVKQLKMYVNGRPYALLNLKDVISKQIFKVDTLQGRKQDLALKFEIADVYKGDKFDDVAISELEFSGIGVH